MKIFESPLIVFIVLILLVLILITRILNNQDLIKNNSKDKLTDTANLKNAYKYFRKQKTFNLLFIVSLLSLIILIISDFTSIDANIIDYFAYDIYKEQELNRLLYLIPIYGFVTRQIILEVKIGDFLLKYYKVDEPVLEENLIKTILYKKPKQTNLHNNQVTQKESK